MIHTDLRGVKGRRMNACRGLLLKLRVWSEVEDREGS